MKQHATHNGIHLSVEDLLTLRPIAREFKLEAKSNSRAQMDGSSRSTRRGRGMEFSEVRHYQAGDDVRNIDWRVTARTQQTFTKLFQEEKERPVYILVDQRSCMFFGSSLQFKSILAAELAAFIAWCALQNNDKISAMVFSDTDQSDLRPKRGKHAVLRFIHELAEFNKSLISPIVSAPSGEQHLEKMLQELLRVARPGSLIYVISDFHDFDAHCERALSLLARHSDIELLHVFDSLETELPVSALLNVTDGKQRVAIDTTNRKIQRQYHDNWLAFTHNLRTKANGLKINLRSVTTETPIKEHIKKLFKSSKSRGGK